jgi:hypothetical protein
MKIEIWIVPAATVRFYTRCGWVYRQGFRYCGIESGSHGYIYIILMLKLHKMR